jgi:hypothetical protein
MPGSLHIVLGVLFAFIPAQAKQIAPGAGKVARGMSVEERGEVCAGLTAEECCGQMLEIAGFRAQGDHLPRLIKNAVQLTCHDERKTVTPQVCRSISVSRGFTLKDAEAICKPAQRDCKKDGTCRKCVNDLSRLAYQGSHHVCHALTYVPDNTARPKVVVIRAPIVVSAEDADTHFEVTTRRTVVR